MTSPREVALSLIALGLNLAAMPALAHPPEPLVETVLTDPDPGFVAPPAEKRSARPRRRSDEEPSLDQAFEDLGRIAGQAARIAQQRSEGRAVELRARAQEAIDRVRANSDKLSEIACASVESARSRGVDVSSWEKNCPR